MIVSHSQYLVNVPEFTSRSTNTVLMVLVSHCHGSKCHTYVSQERIAELTKYCLKTVNRAIKLLESTGIITIVPRYNKKTGKRTSNLYIVKGLGENKPEVTNGHYMSHKEFSETKNHMETKPEYGVLTNQSKKEIHMEEEPTLESGNLEFGACNSELTAPAPANTLPPRPQACSTAPAPANTLPPRPQVRFSGAIPTNQQVVDIYKIYTRSGFASSSEAQFLEFLSTCSAIARKFKEKKIRNFYGYLTHVWKTKRTGKLITDKDEDRARAKLRQLREIGLIDL